MKLYRSIKWGDVAEFFLTDNRQYRDPQAYVTEPACLSMAATPRRSRRRARARPRSTTRRARTSARRRRRGSRTRSPTSTAKWKFIMNGPVITGLLFLPYDRWEGYAAERTEMLEFIRNPDGNTMTDDHLKNVVVLSTDIHAAIYNPAVANPGPGGRRRARDHRRARSAWIRSTASCRRRILPFVSSLPGPLPGDPVLRHRPPELRPHRRQRPTPAKITYRDNYRLGPARRSRMTGRVALRRTMVTPAERRRRSARRSACTA